MKLIAHRGNINGPNMTDENKPQYILDAINSGYYVEIDVWKIDDKLFLGHDNPVYLITQDFFTLQVKERVYAHAKNISALKWLVENNINCFSHDKDTAVLTLQGELWTYPGNELTPLSICVMPEWYTDIKSIENVAGICSDYVGSI
jgi:hypothetical protein